ncbi:MAG: DNA repair protein RecO [Chloroflexi bacterium]|nr:DNA repair protein RecO [Chloroflexota bacterium]
MRDRLYRVQAIILKRSDFGEADRLLTLYTPDHGKIRAIAKGARKPSSRKSGHVELFSHSELLLAKGRQLDIVTQAETRNSFLNLQIDLQRLAFAYYFAELLDQSVEEAVENRPLFDLLLNCLARLAEESIPPALLARYFELHLLQHIGYRPQLFFCIHCGNEITPNENYFSAEAGGVIDSDCFETQKEKIPGHGRDALPISLNALKVLRFLQTREFETARALQLDAELNAELERLMQRYIVHHLERNLKSVAFLQDLKRGQQELIGRRV